ncbi:hypothetical protein BaRGS_00034356, partial [Batillaria attramentaria]
DYGRSAHASFVTDYGSTGYNQGALRSAQYCSRDIVLRSWLVPCDCDTPVPCDCDTPVPCDCDTPVPCDCDTPVPCDCDTPVPCDCDTPVPCDCDTPVPCDCDTPVPCDCDTPVPCDCDTPGVQTDCSLTCHIPHHSYGNTRLEQRTTERSNPRVINRPEQTTERSNDSSMWVYVMFGVLQTAPYSSMWVYVMFGVLQTAPYSSMWVRDPASSYNIKNLTQPQRSLTDVVARGEGQVGSVSSSPSSSSSTGSLTTSTHIFYIAVGCTCAAILLIAMGVALYYVNSQRNLDRDSSSSQALTAQSQTFLRPDTPNNASGTGLPNFRRGISPASELKPTDMKTAVKEIAIERKAVTLGELILEGTFGRVYHGTVLWEEEDDKEGKEQEVAVKTVTGWYSITPLQVDVTPLSVGVTLVQVGITPLQVGVTLLPVGVTLVQDGITPLQVGVMLLPVGVTLLQVGITPLQVGVTLLPVGVTLVQDGITPLQVGVMLLPVGVTLVQVGVTLLPVGVTLVQVGITPLQVGVMLLPVGVTLLQVGITPLQVGVMLLPVGVTLVQVGITPLQVGVMLLPVGVTLLQVGITPLQVGVMLLPVGVTLLQVGWYSITPLQVGVTLLPVGVTLVQVGITPLQVGVMLLPVGVTLLQVGITPLQVGVTLLPVGVTLVQVDQARPDQVSLFLTESMMLKGMAHPNVCTVLGACSDEEGPPLVIYPYTHEGNMKKFLQKCRMSECGSRYTLSTQQLVYMAIQIIRGIQYLHRKKIIHRDIATRNCVVDHGLQVQITDNSLARDLFSSDYNCLGDNENRPVKWMSVEALVNKCFSPASDVWAFGVTLWEMMTLGQQPYADIDPFEMATYLQEGYRIAQPHNCPDELFAVMACCWAMSPDERPKFAQLLVCLQDFYTALGRFI